MFLLGTNIISELRRARPRGAVLRWLEAQEDGDLHISALTLGEIRAGIEITRPQDPDRADEIEASADNLSAVWNIPPVDAAIYKLWTKLTNGRSDHLDEDALVAANARVHGLTIATRNIADFHAFP